MDFETAEADTNLCWLGAISRCFDEAWCNESPAPVLPATTSLATGARRQIHAGPKDQQARDAEGAYRSS